MASKKPKKTPFGEAIAVCGCALEVNESFRKEGSQNRVVTTLFSNKVILKMARADGGRGKLPTLVATYCPFCGKKYPE